MHGAGTGEGLVNGTFLLDGSSDGEEPLMAVEPVQTRPDGGVIYFVQAGPGGSIKIGTTSDLDRRLRELQTGNPVSLILLGTIPGSREEEHVVQSMFKHLQMEGEWFRPGEDLLAFIRDHSGPGPREPVTFVSVKFEPRTSSWDAETTVFAWILGSIGLFIGVAL